jgi:HAE1 family hydrophobic/amphiphilic exporter-1
MSIASVSVNRPIATAMVYLIVIVFGAVSFRYLPVDLLPPIEFPELNIEVNYGNVGPEEMELIVTEQLENGVSGVPNLEQITSQSSQGRADVSLRFSQGTNLDEAANDVRAALDRVRDELPDEIDPPRIGKFDPNQFPVVILGARSNRPLDELTRLLEREIVRDFEQIGGVGAIDVWGGVYREVDIDLLRERLIAYELTAADVANALSRENVNLPGGNVREGLRDLYVRSIGEFDSVDQIADTVVTVVDGNPIRVRDVAQVEFGYEDIGRYTEIADVPAVRMAIRKQTGANTVAVAERIVEQVERINAMRPDLQMQVITNQADFIQGSIDAVKNSAIWGGVLAVIVLLAFLRNASATFVIACAIPISIIATFGLIYFGGLTLNQMSFGGIALGVGLIVDNSIVVLENIFRQRQHGLSNKESALVGTRQVTGAIIAATLTTSVIFIPVVFMRTVTGTLFQELALVVVFALMCSLLVALTLVPMLASRFLTVKPDDPDPAKRPRMQRWFEGLESRYAHVIDRALHHRVAVGMVTAILLVAALAVFPTIPVELAPQTDGDELSVSMRMDDGTNISVMYRYAGLLDEAVRDVINPADAKFITNEVRNNRAQVEIALVPPGERSISSQAMADRLRERIGNSIPGADIRVQAGSGLWILRRLFQSGGNDDGGSLQMQLRGYDQAVSERLIEQIISRVETVPGVADVDASNRERRPEQNIRFDRERMSRLGVGVQEVAAAMQTSVGGRRAGMYRVDGEEYSINVRFRPEDRFSVSDIDNISIRTAEGILPISALVTQETARGPTSIQRIDGQRVNYITANLEDGVPLGDAVGSIQAALAGLAMPDGYSVYFGGEYEEQQQAQRDFVLAIIMALALIYMVMAAQFERFIDPLIVMFSVPLAIIGVVPTLLLTGTTLNLQSFMGIVMLIGIVVNNAIVLVDYINLLRREKGMAVRDAVIEAGRLRLRPILMTTTTTVLGLLPLALGVGTGAEIQAALARVVIGGLLASTLITLVLIPVVYLTTANIVARVQEWRRGGQEPVAA